jgi:hypothetical protein
MQMAFPTALMIPFLYVAGLCLAGFYLLVYAIVFIRLLLGHGDEVLDSQRKERIRLRNAYKD